jgi:heat-inducible transcriptional repressor
MNRPTGHRSEPARPAPVRPPGAAAAAAAAAAPLEPRDRDILKAVVATYILTAEPVGSRSVARQGGLGLSAATIRNVMSDLEERGYLAQPHTSAGRIPTAAGYHLFIEALMRERRVTARDRRYIDENLAAAPAGAERLMAVTSELLTELSHQVGVVVAPALGETVLRAVHFVGMSGRKVLCVVVSAAGFVDNKVIETDEPVPREKLVEISNYLSAQFAGMTLRQIRDKLLARMSEERAQMDRLMALTIRLAREGLAVRDVPELVVGDAAPLLSHPELADIGRVRRLFEAFADKARLVEMLNRCMAGGGVRVLIGEDADLTSELDFSLVATPYGVGGETLGALGVFGPSRMEYQRLIPLVGYVGATLSRALAGGKRS